MLKAFLKILGKPQRRIRKKDLVAVKTVRKKHGEK